MIKRIPTHRSLSVLVTCITTICILAFGMRAPDLTRPHLPKPKPRAYIEQQFKKSLESVAKKSPDQVQAAELTQSCEPVFRNSYRTGLPPAFHGAAASPLFCNLSRAPPAFSA